MNDPTTPDDPRRWPLRVTLAVVVAALVSLSVIDAAPRHRPGDGVTATSVTATTDRGHSTRPSPTTSTVVVAPADPTGPLSSPLANPLVLNEPSRRGCGFVMSPRRVTIPPPMRAIGHCTVLEIGDSIGIDLSWGLLNELDPPRGVTLVQRDKTSTGLAASWYFNWPRHLRALLAQYHPDLTIVCIGGNDQQGLRAAGESYGFNTPGWRRVYRSRVRTIDLLATRARSFVLWVGLPIMAPVGYRQGTAALNSLYRSVARTVPGVTFLPSWNLFASPSGQYRAAAMVNHVRTVLRDPDGIHFSSNGENVLATYVVKEVTALYHVRLAAAEPAVITAARSVRRPFRPR